MKKLVVAGLISAIASVGAAVAEEASPERSIKDLDVLIGKWRYIDQSTDLAGFDYREEGETECQYALGGKYIRCEGSGVYNGKTRVFVEYINYNHFTDEFQRVGFFENHPAHARFTLQVSEDGKRIEQRGAPMDQRDGSVTRNWGVITFIDDDHYNWDVHVNRSTEAADYWPLKFVSTVERVTDE